MDNDNDNNNWIRCLTIRLSNFEHDVHDISYYRNNAMMHTKAKEYNNKYGDNSEIQDNGTQLASCIHYVQMNIFKCTRNLLKKSIRSCNKNTF